MSKASSRKYLASKSSPQSKEDVLAKFCDSRVNVMSDFKGKVEETRLVNNDFHTDIFSRPEAKSIP